MKLQKTMLYIVTAVISGITFLQSCKKEEAPGSAEVASLNIVNALPASAPLIPVRGITGPIIFYNVAGVPDFGSYRGLGLIASISYASNLVLTTVTGKYPVYLVQKNADTISVDKNTLAKYMFNSVLDFSANSAYSLFIMGKDTTAPDYLFVQDMLPYHSMSDSTTGIRFINLSANSNPVSINILGQANGSEASNLAYKTITSFKNYMATSTISSYTFEFRDAGTGTLLTSYSLNGVNGGSTTVANNIRFKNLTIALIGQPGGSGALAQKCMLINNY